MSKYLARTALKRGGNSTNSSSANTSNAAGPRSSLGIFRTRVLLIGFSLVAFLIYHYTQIADVGSNELLPSHLSLRYSTYRGVAPLQSPLRRGRNESENANSDSGVEAIKQFVTSTVKAVARLVRPSGSNGNGNHTVMKGNTLLKSLPCRRSFEPTCEMYSYLRFWNKEFVESDCRQSLLRVPYNQPLPLADRKFLLFEPDRVRTILLLYLSVHPSIYQSIYPSLLVHSPTLGWMEQYPYGGRDGYDHCACIREDVGKEDRIYRLLLNFLSYKLSWHRCCPRKNDGIYSIRTSTIDCRTCRPSIHSSTSLKSPSHLMLYQ